MNLHDTVSLMMMPVCACGHIFNDLRVETERCEIPKDSELILYKKWTFIPNQCPSCNRIIAEVRARELNELHSSVIFITENDLPIMK